MDIEERKKFFIKLILQNRKREVKGKESLRFVPEHPEKYLGSDIFCRSGWERQFCNFLDKNVDVLLWSFEPFHIKYWNPLRRQYSHYFPDFLFLTAVGRIKMIEVKPDYQTKSPPKFSKKGNKRNSKKILKERADYIINISKWKAANSFCKEHDLEFQILTEKNAGFK